MSAIVRSEPPNPHLMRWLLGAFDRRINRLLDLCEAELVEAATGALDAGVRPFEIVTRVQVVAQHPFAGAVAVNSIAAASHTGLLDVGARRDVETLVVACPHALAGRGWLRRLSSHATTRATLVVVAQDARDALTSDSSWEFVVRDARSAQPVAGRKRVA